MRVLLVHLSDGHLGGGGGIAMLRLHQGLRKAGIDSRILCRTKTQDSAYITEIPHLPRLESQLKKATAKFGLNDIHLLGSFKIKQKEAYRDADVIDFQGIHTGTLSYLTLPSLTKNKPAVFTMHDMWAMTGHCVYSYDCERWQQGCGSCPYPDTHPRIQRDNTHLEWHLKKWAYNHSNLAFVAPSRWLFEQATKSMFGQFPIHRIPYGLDTEIYQPLDPEACRVELGIPANKKVLMFAALKLDAARKGGDLLLAALQGLPAALKSELVLLTIGDHAEAMTKEIDIQTVHLGFVSDEHRKAVAYSAADLFLFPTRADNLPLVLLESMACGTPMVSFNVGGVSDLVRPGMTGYLAEPENVEALREAILHPSDQSLWSQKHSSESVTDFRNGIIHLLEDEPLRQHMRQQCRKIILQEYREEIQVKRYIQLYNQLLHLPENLKKNNFSLPSSA